jgi:acetylornithine deacetylase
VDPLAAIAGAPGIDVVALTRALVDVDSTTGREGEAGEMVASLLERRGFEVVRQPVGSGRINVLATAGDPLVTFSTHLDCVPPFFPSRVEGDRLFGRGSCDAKGILAAQLAACDALRRAGETRAALLFVVGEERGSEGARAANELARGSRFLINGEPTDNRLGLATRGALRVKLRATGRAAHSSYPELGESAIDKLVDALVALRSVPLPADPTLGRTHFSVGLIAGGVAPNVIAPFAEAEVMFRTVGDAAEVWKAMAPLGDRVALEPVLEVPAVRLTTVDGFDAAGFPYTTDIPYLTAWGRPLLFGPGSIHAAHTADEHVAIPELKAAVEHYVTIARDLLGRA